MPTKTAFERALKPFGKPSLLGTPKLAKYEIEWADVPKVVQAGMGGRSSNRQSSTRENVFYKIAVEKKPVFIHYFRYRMTAKIEEWTTGMDLYNNDGECIGNGEPSGDGVVIEWGLHGEP